MQFVAGPGAKGDWSVLMLAPGAIAAGAKVAAGLLVVVKALIMGRDERIKVKMKCQDGTTLEIDAKNVGMV